MPDISQHTWKCAWMTTSLRSQREPNNSIFETKPLNKAIQHTTFFQTSFPREPVPARKREKYGHRYIYIREHYSEQVPCTQHTHTSGYRARESSTELPTTEDGKFQHGGTSILQLQCRDHPTDGTQNGKGITVTSSQVTPMDPIQLPTRECISTMNVHSQDSHSNKTD